MPKPMTVVLWGSIISIAGALIGGAFVAIGKYQQDVASSKKSDTILFNTEEGLGISKITKQGVKELIDQKNKLDSQVAVLLRKQEQFEQGQNVLTQKLEPFVTYAQKMFPNVNADEALVKLENLLEEQTKRLDKTDQRVGKVEKDIDDEKDKIKPQFAKINWRVKNQRTASVPLRFMGLRPTGSIDIKEKFNVDHVIFNEIEFEYRTVVNRSEFTFLLNKNDVVHCLISISNGMLNFATITARDGRKGFRLTQPQTGIYVLRIYSKTELNDLNGFLLTIDQ
jgi:hypothetical protein